MWKAREDGCSIKVRYGKVLFCGANGAGKTNFLNLLLEEEFNTKHVSTEVAKPQQATVAMKAQISKFYKDGDVIFKKMNIYDEIQQLTSYLPKKYTTPHSQQDTTMHDQQVALSDNQQKLKNEENSTIDHKKIPKYQKSHTDAESIMSSKLVYGSAVSKSSPKTQLTEDVWDILTFMDTGGQPQYISMLPAVNSFAMITFIVHKMTGGRKSLDDKFMVQHGNKKGEHSFKPYKHESTYLQLIKTLMSYASVNFFPDNSFLNEKKICNDQTHSRSISFVGTHSKNVSDDDIMEIDKILIDIIENSSSENIKVKLNEVYKYLVPIDNKEQNKSLSERNEINKSADNEEHDAKNTQILQKFAIIYVNG